MKVKSWKRFFWLPVALLLLGTTMLLSVSSSVWATEEYVSLYPFAHYEVTNCLKTPCNGYIRHVTKFVDPELLSGSRQATDDEQGVLTLMLQSTNSSAGYISGFPGAFRLFIPPGTVSVSIAIAVTNDPGELVFRYQVPPSSSSGSDINWNESYDQGDLDVMKEHNVYRRLRTIRVQDRFSPFLDDSGWLYIKNLNGVILRSMTASITVNLAEFVAWYNSPDVRWDENGDPWSADNGVASVEVCAPDNLDACNESNCSTAGEGYWYNDVEGGNEYCHQGPPNCSGDDCQTESQCLSAAADLYWYEDEVGGVKSCHQVPACEWDRITGAQVDCTPVNCITSAQCDDANFHWYEDEVDGPKTCHEVKACERNIETGAEEVCSAANCITEDQCTSSDFYWYEDEVDGPKTCHEMKACERNIETGAEEVCSADNCITADQCDDAHFYWYKDAGEDAAGCHQDPQQGVCSQDNLHACMTESECVDAGGEWHDNLTCWEKRSPSQTYTPSASSSSTSSTSSGSSTGSSTNWLAAFFNRPAAAAPVVSCDALHLDACDQTGCAGLGDGYWWYDGACRNEPVQADFSRHLSSAPVSPGAGADDGVIAAGEGLSFNIAVPAGCRLYAALSIPNLGAFFISNDEILTADMVPVASGTIPVINDICPLLTGEWEDLKGTWTVYTLAVPAAVGESPAQLGAYLEQGGLYAFGSYNIEVGCQEVQPQVHSGYTLYDIQRPSPD